MIPIELTSEYVLQVGGLSLTNTFVTSVLVSLLLMGFAVWLYYQPQQHAAKRFMQAVVYELLAFIDGVTGDRRLSKHILPLVSTFFFFILSANVLALLPGFLGAVFVHARGQSLPLLRSPNSDLTTTLALAVISVLSIQLFSLRALGLGGYVRRFFNVTNPVLFVLGFFEMLSEAVKVLSFSFRLFGNVFAGEVLLLVTGFLLPYLVPLPFMVLEVFVGAIQAFIFAALTMTFIKTSTMRHLKPRASSPSHV